MHICHQICEFLVKQKLEKLYIVHKIINICIKTIYFFKELSLKLNF